MKGTKLNTWLLALSFILVLAACRPKKLIVAPKTVDTLNIDSGMAVSAESLLAPIQKDWKYFSSKVDFEFSQDGNTNNANAHVRMYKDSLIWISAGFGFIRIMINNDSMVVLDKLNTNYRVYDKKEVAELIETPLNVTQIQNLLLGQPAFALKLYSLNFLKDSNVQILYHQEKFDTEHVISKSTLTLDSTRIDDNLTMNYASALYSSYTEVDGHNFPLKTEIFASGKKPIRLKLSYSEPDFTTELTFPFTIPSTYEKVK